MGAIFDFFTGGNAKVVANSLGRLHFDLGGDYTSTYVRRVMTIIEFSLSKNNAKTYTAVSMVRNNEIRNYVDICVLDLNINAAPNFVSYFQTFNDFSEILAKHLLKQGIPQQYIWGDNRDLTKEFTDGIKDF